MSTSASFVGSIPEFYDRHLGPVIFEPMARDLARRLTLPARARVLEVATGTGISLRRLVERLPADGRYTATDLNAPMLDYARSRAARDERVEWMVADAMALPFEDGTFDAYVSQFGVMFFPDKPAAMREARRVLTPGGRLLFNVWGDFAQNSFGRIGHEVITSYFTSDPPKFYLTPFGWNDRDEIRAAVEGAGFRDVAIELAELPAESISAEDFAAGLVRGNPVLLEIQERATADVATIEAAAAAALTKDGGAKPWRGTIRALVVSATA